MEPSTRDPSNAVIEMCPGLVKRKVDERGPPVPSKRDRSESPVDELDRVHVHSLNCL